MEILGSPVTERVSTSRRGPLAVLLVVATIVLVLAWKPWDKPAAVAPSPSALAARPTTSPTPTAMPTAVPTPSTLPTDTPMPPTTPPATEPPPSASPRPSWIDIEVGSVFPGDAFVTCSYRHDGEATVLARVLVNPPAVQLQSDYAERGVRRVSWRAELQVNHLEAVFSANWQPVATSPRQFAAAQSDSQLTFLQIDLGYDQSPPAPTSVIRVVVVVEWFGAHRALLGSRDVVATTYGVGMTSLVVPEGCPTSP